MKEMDEGAKIGLLGGLIASLCCIGPLALVSLGLGVSSALILGFYSPYFLALGVLLLALSSYLHLKHKEGKCDLYVVKKHWQFIPTALLTGVFLYLLIIHVLVPFLAPIVYGSIR